MQRRSSQLIIKFGLILFCCLFVGLTRLEEPASCQSCVVSFWEPPPKDSWLQNEQVTVRIDASWNSSERGFFRQGIEKWNSAANCSNVTFSDFSPIHFDNFNSAPPDQTLWWQKRSPVGVLYFFLSPQADQRLRAVIVPIPANFPNIFSNSYYVYLGTHEVGHTLDLNDCLAANNCQALAGTCSIMGGHSQNPSFNTGGPLLADNNSVNVVYCPEAEPDSSPSPSPNEEQTCYDNLGFWFNNTCVWSATPGCEPGQWGFTHPSHTCEYWYTDCQCLTDSPIVIDINGDGFSLTNAANGVQFDLSNSAIKKKTAWTAPGSDDVWLVLDRNGNGLIDDGTEMFGNYTNQPEPPPDEKRNGFLALAEYDKTAHGGNNDGKINQRDSIFMSLRLWKDVNHNGVSETGELFTLPALGLGTIELDYQIKKRIDEFGNGFRYRAKVKDHGDAQLGRWAWDVFLVTQP